MRRACLLSLMLVAVAAAFPQQPQIQNAKIETRQAADLGREIASIASSATEPVWIAWREPIIDGEYDLCCTSIYDASVNGAWGSVYSRGCSVDPVTAGAARPQFPASAGPVKLEGGTGLVLLVRIVDHHVERLRSLSDDCPLDAGGRTVYWMEGVSPDASVTYLDSLRHLVDGTRDNLTRLADSAMSAIAYHRDPAALDALLTLARDPNDAHTRVQALHLLGRRNDARATAVLTSALADPAAEIRRAALSGIASLPKDASVPRLIDIVKTTKDLDLRKSAMTYLSQSQDPRAIAFFQEIVRR